MLKSQSEVPLLRGISAGARELIGYGSNYTLYCYDQQYWPPTTAQPGPRLPIFALLGAGAEPEPYAARLPRETDLHPGDGGAAEFAAAQQKTMGELVECLVQTPRLLLYIHGYSNDSAVVAETTCVYPRKLLADTARKGEEPGIGAWVNYDWPGERALGRKARPRSARTVMELSICLLIWLALLAGGLWLLGRVALLLGSSVPEAVQPWLSKASVLLACGFGALSFAVWFLRVTAYHRDVYMALHRGVPDLCEFLRRLDYEYCRRQEEGSLGAAARFRVDIIAHSMGTMVTLNTVRILSDLFAGGPEQPPSSAMGRSLALGTLVLVGADVPVELLQASQNNYFYSALRRFERMTVFSSAHDGVLHMLGYYANSSAEPQPGGSRSRLGTVFHPMPGIAGAPPGTAGVCARRWFKNEPVFGSEAKAPRPDPTILTDNLSFIDCSRRSKLSAPMTRALGWFPPLRDFLALLLYVLGRIDCHAGYFADDGIWALIHDAIRNRLPSGQAGNLILE